MRFCFFTDLKPGVFGPLLFTGVNPGISRARFASWTWGRAFLADSISPALNQSFLGYIQFYGLGTWGIVRARNLRTSRRSYLGKCRFFGLKTGLCSESFRFTYITGVFSMASFYRLKTARRRFRVLKTGSLSAFRFT